MVMQLIQCHEREESTFIGKSYSRGEGPENEVEDEPRDWCNKYCLTSAVFK